MPDQIDFRQMADLAPGMIALLNSNLSFVYINAAGAMMLGVAEMDSMRGLALMDFIHPADRSAFTVALERFAQDTELTTLDLDYRIIRRVDHQIIWIGGTISRMAYGDQPAFRVSGHDRTRHKHIEQALKASQQKFITIFQDSPEGILLVQPISGIIIGSNQAVGTLLMQQPDSLIGRNFYDLFPRSVSLPEFRTQLEEQSPLIELRNFTRPDGTVIPLDLTMAYVSWNAHRQVLAVTLHDTTEHAIIENERREKEAIRMAYEKEHSLNEIKSRFMSIVSHEFRTPLATIQTSTELLEHYYERMTPERREVSFNTIRDQIRYLAEMLEDMGTVINVESGRLFFTPVLLDVVGYCQELITEVQHTFRTSHRIILTTTGDFPDLMLDPVLLRHILRNLLSNAVKYSPEADEVRLELVRTGGGDVIFRVIDHGIGIPEEEHDMLFQTYARASNAGTIRGVGMGLRIVWDAVHLHRGEIRFTSAKGKGTTFTVILHPVDAR